jgi:phage head maturation protease
VSMYSWLEPGHYSVNAEGRPIKTKSARRQVAEGWVCAYNVEHTNFKTGQREIFLPSCFTGSLTGLLLLRDHVLSEKALANQDDGDDLEVHDCEAGLAIRVHVKDGMLDRLEGRDQFSVGYHVLDSSVRSDAVRLIKKAVLIEVSLVHVGAVRQTFMEIRDSEDVGPLEIDSKNWAYDGAGRGFLRELRKLQ